MCQFVEEAVVEIDLNVVVTVRVSAERATPDEVKRATDENVARLRSAVMRLLESGRSDSQRIGWVDNDRDLWLDAPILCASVGNVDAVRVP